MTEGDRRCPVRDAAHGELARYHFTRHYFNVGLSVCRAVRAGGQWHSTEEPAWGSTAEKQTESFSYTSLMPQHEHLTHKSI